MLTVYPGESRMPRPHYQIADDDVAVVHRWLRPKLREATWSHHGASLTAWDQFRLDHPTARKCQQWYDRFLDAAQWKQLHAVIRAARRDANHLRRTVRLSTRASVLLHDLAESEQLMLSATIKRYLAPVPITPSHQETPPAAEQPPMPPPATR